MRAGGRQEKVEVGTIVQLDRVQAAQGDKIELPAVLFVDGDTVTTDADKLAKVKVTAEVVSHLRGPKIVIQKFKNKTGYKKRQGHRQELTRVKVTGIK
ncbi:50S ribosomal protein L21 [Microbacterium resistens]|nr:50S ribosomal protein L21 [Microbacterium resistens]